MKNYLLFLFIAISSHSFSQGYNYLGNFSSNGTPLYLHSPGDEVNSATMDLINGALPDGFSVPEYNPHYISSGYDTDINLKADAEIFITYLGEDTEYKNVLGFYTYRPNNPPKTAPAPEDITIIFPNVKDQSKGGALKRGDKISLGTFQNSTSICFVLLADGWDGTRVTSGKAQYYSNPAFNPELEDNLKHHQVLLADLDNERVFLGFEDKRRDSTESDHDFNDNLFYITASTFSAMKTANMIDIKTAAEVTSANDGGLESNGALAELIALRNFKRTKNNTIYDNIKTQKFFDKEEVLSLKSAVSGDLVGYIPETGMFGTEIAYVSSPEDLIGITNAEKVFSVDFYQDNQRVSAIFATETKGSVYDHKKVICDRLNSSSLEDIRNVTVRGHQIISTEIKRANGQVEKSISFSIQLGETENTLYSFWNLDEYPEGNYYNFQIWGNSFSQVFALANQILDEFSAEKELKSEILESRIPAVFVKSGQYSNGEVVLNIVNKTSAEYVDISSSISPAENAERVQMTHTANLSGEWNDSIRINTGSLFDIGLSIYAPGSELHDALYLADGPWGLDYLESETIIDEFFVDNRQPEYNSISFVVERQPLVMGSVKGTVNLFRQILPGHQSLDVSAFNALSFTIKNSHPVEVILMTDDLTDWDNRLRTIIPANAERSEYALSFNHFVDGEQKSASAMRVTRIVFSVQGDYQNFSPFTIDIENVAFTNNITTSVNQLNESNTETDLVNYPNPFSTTTTIRLTQPMENVQIKVFDLAGRIVDLQNLDSGIYNNELVYYNRSSLNGLYKYILSDSTGKTYNGTFLIQKK